MYCSRDYNFTSRFNQQYEKSTSNKCKFDNDATTIRIFIKGLKNAHSLATKVYEKGPQSLADTIREVKNFRLPNN